MDGYYAFMLVATAFVLMMTVPALALFYGGMSRSKSVLNMMMMSFIAAAIVGILYVAVGWSMGFGGDGTFFANPFELFWLEGVTTDNYIYVMFQMTFAIITAALISGAVADRLKFSAWVVFVPLWALIVYFPMAHMVFSCTDDSLICGRIGAQDYAGGTAVHINAGVAALVLVLLLGKRIGWPREQMRPHNLTLTMLGAGMLWLGWYGFNVGSIVFGTGFDEGPDAFLAQLLLRDRPHLRQHHARHHGRHPRLAARSSGCSTRRPPRSVPPPASSPAWSRSPRPPVRSTSAVPWPSASSPVASAPGPSA